MTIGAYAPESEVADLLRQVEEEHPGVAIGSYPFYGGGRLGANFVLRGEGQTAIDRCAEELGRRLAAAGLESVPGGIAPPPR